MLQFFDHVGMPLCNVPTVAKVLIPKSIIYSNWIISYS